MYLCEIFRLMEGNDDHLHARALQQTGFWGAQGAGLIYFAQRTKRFLLAHRSSAVEQPGEWGTWGGAIDRNENPLSAARREADEETGYHGPMLPVPLFVFRKNDFQYSNFLGIIDAEFKPRLNWENQGFRWCDFGKWPRPLHFGFVAILNDPASIKKMQTAMEINPSSPVH